MQMRARNRSASLSKAALIAGVFLFSALGARGQSDDAPPGEWRIAGQNLRNSLSQPAEHTINPSNVNRLTPKWVFTSGADVSATPTVDGNAVYFPDLSGSLFPVQQET